MNAKMKKTAWGLIALLGMTATQARAANPAKVNIDVSITAALSVSVDGVASSTRTHSWSGTPNQAFDNSASSITVLNDTGILTESWALSTPANTSAASGATWARVGSTTAVPADSYAAQAVFGSSNTAASGAGGCGDATAGVTWANGTIAPPLTTSPVTYTSTVFAAAQLNNAGGSPAPDLAAGSMYAGNKRALCYRIIMPASTSVTTTQNVQVIVTAQ